MTDAENATSTAVSRVVQPDRSRIAYPPGPYYAPLAEFDIDKARRDVDTHLMLPILIARQASGKVRPGGTLLFLSGIGGRRTARS